jgi:hypothetical protein
MLPVTLRYLAGVKVLKIGWPYGLGDSTVSLLLDETLECISNQLENIVFPKTEEDANREAAAFQSLRDSPLFAIVGALDGIAFAIKCPTAADAEDARKIFLTAKAFIQYLSKLVYPRLIVTHIYQRNMQVPLTIAQPSCQRCCVNNCG